jgi:hypothetical protein
MKRLSGAPLWFRPLALPTTIKLGWKGMPGTNAIAYSKITAVKSFITSGPDD